jgi:GTPase
VSRGLVAVVGRPNVGKSTLFNRLVGDRIAIVEDEPGTTRDRLYATVEWRGREFTLVDTGGLDDGTSEVEAGVRRQAEAAIEEADVVMFVVDAQSGVLPVEHDVADRLRRSRKPVVMAANKSESWKTEAQAAEFYELGLGELHTVSALQGIGTGDLLDAVVAKLPPPSEDETDADEARIAIVGRPNVGKSSFLNRLAGEERAVVSEIPGTTRDAIDTVVSTPEGPIRFVDTAGMRRKSRVGEGAEYYSLVRALQAIDRADAALLVIDSAEGVTHQDQRLAERVDAAGSPVVIVLNKWDLLDAERRADVTDQLSDRLHFLGYAPVLKVSARSGKGVHKLLPALTAAIDAYHRRVPTRELNQVVQAAQAAHPAPTGRVLYATQGATDPPTFTLFSNRALPAPYLRYLERRIREHFRFGPTPLKLRVRKRAG